MKLFYHHLYSFLLFISVSLRLACFHAIWNLVLLLVSSQTSRVLVMNVHVVGISHQAESRRSTLVSITMMSGDSASEQQ
jgi:hypothetical protein